MKMRKILAAAFAPIILIAGLTACDSDGGDKTADIAPSEVVKAVLAEVPIDDAAEKDKSEVKSYYSNIDTEAMEDGAFALCRAAQYPDEIAVIKFKSDSDADEAKTAFQARLDSQKELYETYSPDEMYKLESAVIYSKGRYAIFIALSDNEKAKSIVEEKLSA